MNPLRELDEAGGLRTQLFGNPFKLERQADKTVCVYIEPPVEQFHVELGPQFHVELGPPVEQLLGNSK